MEFIELLELEQKEKEEQKMTLYAVYIDTYNDESYDTFHSVHDKASDAIITANELEHSQVFVIQE